jgi:hypothetical protein
MATETFFKKIIISKEAAEIMAFELGKEKEPYVPKFDAEEVERNTKQWLARYRSKKSLAQKTKCKKGVGFDEKAHMALCAGDVRQGNGLCKFGI